MVITDNNCTGGGKIFSSYGSSPRWWCVVLSKWRMTGTRAGKPHRTGLGRYAWGVSLAWRFPSRHCWMMAAFSHSGTWYSSSLCGDICCWWCRTYEPSSLKKRRCLIMMILQNRERNAELFSNMSKDALDYIQDKYRGRNGQTPALNIVNKWKKFGDGTHLQRNHDGYLPRHTRIPAQLAAASITVRTRISVEEIIRKHLTGDWPGRRRLLY